MAKQKTARQTKVKAIDPVGSETVLPRGEGGLTRDSFMSKMRDLAEPTEPDTGSPGAAAETPTEPAPNGHDTLPELAEPGQTGDGKKTAKGGDAPKPKTLNELAEALGVGIEDVYKIAVNIDAGGKGAETRTLGELKDAMAKTSDFENRVLAFEEQREKQENDVLRAKREMAEILSALPPGTVNSEVLRKAKERSERAVKAERERTLEVIPEWADDEREAEDRAGIQSHLKEYGFDASFLDSSHDHRLIKYFRDNWRRLESVRRALAQTRETKQPSHEPSARTTKRPGDGAAQIVLPDTGGRPLTPKQMRSTFQGLR